MTIATVPLERRANLREFEGARAESWHREGEQKPTKDRDEPGSGAMIPTA